MTATLELETRTPNSNLDFDLSGAKMTLICS